MGAQVPKNNGMILVDNASYQEAIEEAKATGMLVPSTQPGSLLSLSLSLSRTHLLTNRFFLSL